MRILNLIVVLAVGFTVNAKVSKTHLLSSITNHGAPSLQLNIGQFPQSKIFNAMDTLIVAHNNDNDNGIGQKQLDSNLASEILAGFVVSLATIPKAIAYSSVLGVSPLTGIWTSVIVSLFTTLLGNCPGLISGAAGVLILPMSKMMHSRGSAAMSATVILSGIFEALFGFFKGGKLLDVVSENVTAGFLAAVVLFLLKTQVSVFKASNGQWLSSGPMLSSVGISLLCAGLNYLLPVIAPNSKVPPSLVGLGVSAAVASGLKLPIKSLADSVGKAAFQGGLKSLPQFTGLPSIPTDFGTLSSICSTALGAAIIAVVETVLAQKIFHNSYRSRIAGTTLGDPDRASIGLGMGNIASALIGGFGGCGLIPNTMLNGVSGGYGYASSYSFAVSMALAVLVFSPVLGLIPMASLAGVMLTVAVNTMEWKETWHLLRLTGSSPQALMDVVAMLVTTLLCYKVDMGLGVVVGVLLTKAIPALSYAQARIARSSVRKENDIKGL